MISTGRAPANVRASTSRPRSSVPNRCDRLGALSVKEALTALGSAVRLCEKIAIAIQNSTTAEPIMNVGLCSKERTI